MPTIAVFSGITIRIYYRPREHPPPHFHAIYGDHEASYDIRTRRAISGKLPRTQHNTVIRWATAHQQDLLNCWDRAMAGQEPGKIS